MTLSNPVTRAALFDELVKISAASNYADSEHKRTLGPVLRSALAATAGGAAGYGVADLLARNLEFFKQPTTNRARLAKIILPILSGSAVMMADRYRQKLNDEYSKVRGFKDRDKPK